MYGVKAIQGPLKSYILLYTVGPFKRLCKAVFYLGLQSIIRPPLLSASSARSTLATGPFPLIPSVAAVCHHTAIHYKIIMFDTKSKGSIEL